MEPKKIDISVEAKESFTDQELEHMGDGIDLLRDEPEFRELFLKTYPHMKEDVEKQIKERKEIKNFLANIDTDRLGNENKNR